MAPRLRVEAYDPDAVDADNDGIVQEGTAFERPAATQIVDELGNVIQAGITAMSRGNFRVVNSDGSAVKYTPTYERAKPDSRLGISLGARQGNLGDRLPSLGATVGTLADRGTNVSGERKAPPKTPDAPNMPDAPSPARNVEKFKEALPDFRLESESDYATARQTLGALTGDKDGLDQTFLQEVIDSAGDVELRNGQTVRQSLEQGYGDNSYLAITGWGGSDDLLEAIDGSALSDEDKARLRDNINIAQGLSDVGRVRLDMTESESSSGGFDPFGFDAPAPAPAAFDPFGFDDAPKPEVEEKPKVTPAELSQRIDEALMKLPDSFGERIGDAVKARKERTAQAQKRADRKSELEDSIKDMNRRTRGGPRPDLLDGSERIAPVGQATRVLSRTDPNDHKPQEGVTRSPQEVQQLAESTLAPADDLLKPEHRDELISLLTENEEIVATVGLLRLRDQQKRDGTYAEANQGSRYEGTQTAGRSVVDALIRERGYDGDVLQLTSDEMDLFQTTRGAVPLSRGGNEEMNRRHIENDGLPIGEGVDGAGLYFAVEGSNPEFGINETQHEADIYAGENGTVVRAAITPGARTMPIANATKILHEYRLEAQGDGEGVNNPMVQLRRELASDPSKAEALQALDDLMLLSTDENENYENAKSIISILMGYDGMHSYSKESTDNRIILHNRTAFVVQNTAMTGSEFRETKSWDAKVERARAIGDAMNIPVQLDAQEQAAWVERMLETEFGAQ